MATSKPRFPITIEPETAEIIEKYRHENRIKSTSKATVELLLKGIDELSKSEAEKEDKKNKPPTDQEAQEAMKAVLYYRLNRPPSDSEMELFTAALSILVDGIKDKR